MRFVPFLLSTFLLAALECGSSSAQNIYMPATSTPVDAPIDIPPALVTPIVPQVVPPEISPRPVRPDVGEALLLPGTGTRPKPPLSWRARAYKASQSNAGSATFPVPYAEALVALLAAIPQAGLAVETLNSNAGQVLVTSFEKPPSVTLVFSVAETSAGVTTITPTISGDERASRRAAVSNVLKITGDLLSKRGAI